MKNIFRKNNKIFKLIILIILLLISVKIVYYGRLIIPQLNDKPVYTSEQIKLSNDNEVIQVLEKSKDFHANQLYELGNEMLKKKKYKEAYNLYIKLLEKKLENNDELLVYSDIASCYLGIENYDKAIEYAEKSLSLINNTCKHENIYYAYSTAAIIFYYREKKYGFIDSERTIELTENALAAKPDNLSGEKFYQERILYLYAYLADIYNFSSTHYSPEKALEIYEKLLKSDSENKLIYFDIAMLYLELNDIQNAEKYIDLFNEKENGALESLLLKGFYYIKINDLMNAKDIINKLKILSVSDANKSNYYYLCCTYYEQTGDLEEAKEYLKMYVDIDKSQVFLYGTMQLEQRLGLNLDNIREEIRLQNEEYNKISLELEQPISD